MTEKLTALLTGEPTLKGPGGRAWCLLSEMTRANSAALATWFVNCPGAHPLWSWWMVSVVHLRELPGEPPVQKQYPEAAYEFTIIALQSPQGTRAAAESLPSIPIVTLRPIDVVFQFHGVGDQDAARVATVAVETIMRGALSPDQDYRRGWEAMLAQVI